MPALEALLDRFAGAHVQPLGISVDSVYCHAHWAASLGGISFPLLADFHPKGEVARSFGLYLEDHGITDRATVLIDADGVIRHISSVTPAGERDIGELADLCSEIDATYNKELVLPPSPPGLEGEMTLYVKSGCPFSAATLAARENLHLGDRLPVRNVTEDESAHAELLKVSGKDQAPCLVVAGKPMLESKDIIAYLTKQATHLVE